MELELGLGPPNNQQHHMNDEELDLNSSTAHHAYNVEAQSNHYHNDAAHFRHPHKWRKLHHQLDNDYEEHDEEIEGWPPIRHDKSRNEEHDEHGHGDDGIGCATSGNQCMYVKVKMEGVGIGRKIDLSLYHSYHSLTLALINMFAKYAEITADNRILYKDGEGDWMLLGDVPWEMFIESVQRMEILRSSE